MKYTTKSLIIQVAPVRLHALVVFSFLLLALLSQTPEASAGWITNPPPLISLPQAGRGRPQRSPCCHHSWPVDGWQVCQRGQVPLLRSLLLWMLAWRHGGRGALWPAVVPWLLWLWQEAGRFWPWLLSQPEWRSIGWLLWQGQRLLLFWLIADETSEALMDRLAPAKEALTPGDLSLWGIGALLQEEKSPSVTVTEDEQYYTAILQGTFTLLVQKDDPFRQRFLILFLGLLDVPGETRKSRRSIFSVKRGKPIKSP